MINKPSWANEAKFDSETANGGFNKIECKPYRIKILDVVDKPEYEAFIIYFDIVEQGSMAGFFAKEWRDKQKENKTITDWSNKGRYFVSYKESAQQQFQAFITSVQNSNQGYQWDWNEQSLKGKMLVMVYGEEEYQKQDGSIGITISPRMPRSIKALNNNEIAFPLPIKKYRGNTNKKPQNNTYNNNIAPSREYQKPSYEQPNYNNVQIDDDDLPF